MILNENQLQEVEQNLSTNTADMIRSAEICQIVDAETAERGNLLAQMIKETLKANEEQRDSMVRPANNFVKSINQLFARFSDPLKAAKAKVDQKLIAYQREQARIIEEQKRAEIEERAKQLRLEAEQLAAQNKEKQAALIESAAVIVEAEKTEVKVATQSLKTATGTFKIRKIKKFKIANLQMLIAQRPDLVIANEKLIGEMVRGGVKEIAGVEIWEEEIAG